MKSIKLIAILFLMLVILPLSVSATSYNPSEIAKKEYVTGQYGKISCSLGIGDCIYLITNKDGSTYYRLDRTKLLPGSIINSKSQISATINLGETASITYTVKGSGADGFNSHNQRYEWYDYTGKLINNFQINLPFDKEYVVIQKIASPPKPGGYGYTIIEWIEINLENQCYYLHENPCSEQWRQVWAKGDEYYPDVIVLGVTPTPHPTYTVSPTPYPTYTVSPTPYQTYTPQPTPTYPKITTTPIKPKIIPKTIADFIGIKESPGFEMSFAIIGIIAVLAIRRKL